MIVGRTRCVDWEGEHGAHADGLESRCKGDMLVLVVDVSNEGGCSTRNWFNVSNTLSGSPYLFCSVSIVLNTKIKAKRYLDDVSLPYRGWITRNQRSHWNRLRICDSHSTFASGIIFMSRDCGHRRLASA